MLPTQEETSSNWLTGACEGKWPPKQLMSFFDLSNFGSFFLNVSTNKPLPALSLFWMKSIKCPHPQLDFYPDVIWQVKNT
jgi:hypothetical protein